MALAVSLQAINYFALHEPLPVIDILFLTTSCTGVCYDWQDVRKALDGTDFAVVSGRIGEVGVGGNIVGSELRFFFALWQGCE